MDAFAVFEEKRLPYLDREKLKEKFLIFSAENHPDKFRHLTQYREIEEKFSQKHEAYRILSQPKLRLAHLLELEFNFKPDAVKTMPKEAMDLGWKLGEVFQKADELKAKEPSLTSALAKALFSNEKIVLLPIIRDLNYVIESKLANLEEQAKLLNKSWEKGVKERDVLIELYYSTAFITRWSQQIEERLVWLMS